MTAKDNEIKILEDYKKKKKERKMIINRQSDQRRALRDRHQNHVNGQQSTNESPLKMR